MTEFKPNTTQFPNFLLDRMSEFTDIEWKVICVIVRKTYGWHKDKDRISLSQLILASGDSKPSVIKAGKSLREKGVISSELVDGITEYMILLPVNDVDKVNERVVKSEILCSKKPSSCVVSEVDTQKKEYTKEIIQKKEEVFFLKPEIREDPFFPTYDDDNSKMVHKILSENAKEKYDTGIEKDLANCNKIYSLLISDDKESELREKLIQYEFTWWAEQGKQPNAKHVVGAWSTMLASKVPKWYRDGYASHEDALKAIQRAPVTRTSAVPERFTPAESDIVNFEQEMRALKGELEVTPI